MLIELKHCAVGLADGMTVTQFRDGTSVCGAPHWTPHYHVIAHRLGYGDDVERYCFEHEFCHSFLEERWFNRPSRVLWALAHDLPAPDTALYEEIAAQQFQGWLRGNIRPIVSDCDWDALKRDALGLLQGVGR